MGCCSSRRSRSFVAHQIVPAPTNDPPLFAELAKPVGGSGPSQELHDSDDSGADLEAGESESSGSSGEGLSPEQLWLRQARRQERQERRRKRRKKAERAVKDTSVRAWASGDGLDLHYAIGERIGRGCFASVSTCTHLATKTVRALKSIDRKKCSGVAATTQLQREVAISQKVDHPYIVKTIESFEDAKYVHIIMELCAGGELYDRIVVSKGIRGEAAGALAKQMASALQYLHSNCIAHRDLKPENFMLYDTQAVSSATIKMIDFGFSRYFDPAKQMQTLACTPHYVAPEVLQGRYTQTCDVWSLGVVLYVLLCGVPPFCGSCEEEVLQKVKAGVFDFDVPTFSSVGDPPRDLIRKMVEVDVKARLTADQVMEHKWVATAKSRSTPWGIRPWAGRV